MKEIALSGDANELIEDYDDLEVELVNDDSDDDSDDEIDTA